MRPGGPYVVPTPHHPHIRHPPSDTLHAFSSSVCLPSQSPGLSPPPSAQPQLRGCEGPGSRWPRGQARATGGMPSAYRWVHVPSGRPSHCHHISQQKTGSGVSSFPKSPQRRGSGPGLQDLSAPTLVPGCRLTRNTITEAPLTAHRPSTVGMDAPMSKMGKLRLRKAVLVCVCSANQLLGGPGQVAEPLGASHPSITAAPTAQKTLLSVGPGAPSSGRRHTRQHQHRLLLPFSHQHESHRTGLPGGDMETPLPSAPRRWAQAPGPAPAPKRSCFERKRQALRPGSPTLAGAEAGAALGSNWAASWPLGVCAPFPQPGPLSMRGALAPEQRQTSSGDHSSTYRNGEKPDTSSAIHRGQGSIQCPSRPGHPRQRAGEARAQPQASPLHTNRGENPEERRCCYAELRYLWEMVIRLMLRKPNVLRPC